MQNNAFSFSVRTAQLEIGRLQSKCVQLESALAARDQELALAEARYRKYAEKAKEVIKNLDPRVISGNCFDWDYLCVVVIYCLIHSTFLDSVQNSDKNSDTDQDPANASTSRSPMGPLEERLMTTAFYK